MAMASNTPNRRKRGPGRPGATARRFLSPASLRAGTILLLGAAAFALTVQVSVVGVLRSTRPQLALRVAPFDAEGRTKLAAQLEASPQPSRALALDAIRRDPVQPAALRILAGNLDESDPEAAWALIMQSQRLSRRDLPTQMWLIEHFGRQGNAAAAIRHADLALRTSESARPGIFPLLEAAASDPEGRRIILRTVSNRPNWTRQFASYAVASGTDLEFSADVARLLLDSRKPEDRQQYYFLLNRLVQAGHHATAWQLYFRQGLAPANAVTKTVRNGDFEAAEDGSPFDWNFAQEPELWAARESGEGNASAVLRVAAFNGRSGEVAWQIVRLSARTYRLHVRMGDTPPDRYERPELRIECAGQGGQLLATLISTSGGSAPRSFSTAFVVPRNCPFQRISIRLAGQGPLREPAPWIDDLQID